MPNMLLTKLSGNHLSRLDSEPLASARDEADHGPPRPSSRLASFAPFRRSTLLSNDEPHPTSRPMLSGTPNAGGVADVPSVSRPSTSASSSSKAPFKPPKPAALRVKRVKGLSISLLSNNLGNANTAAQNDVKVVDQTQSTSSSGSSMHNAVPKTLQEALAAEDARGGRYPVVAPKTKEREQMPPRSASALDFYHANGPTKGLARKEWPARQREADGLENDTSVDNAFGIRQSDPRRSLGINEPLFIIGHENPEPTSTSGKLERRRSTSLSLEHQARAQSSPVHEAEKRARENAFPSPVVSQSPWKLDTARELLSAATWDDKAGAYSPMLPHGLAAGSGKLPLRTSPRAAATPFLNTFTAQAKMQTAGERNASQSKGIESGTGIARPTTGGDSRTSSNASSSAPSSPPLSRIPRHKGSPTVHQNHHLGKSDILRSTHRVSTDSSSSSTPSSQAPGSPLHHTYVSSLHSRTSSANEFTPSPARKRPDMRVRTQSHAFGASIGGLESQLAPDKSVPQHPLSAQLPTFAAAQRKQQADAISHDIVVKEGALPPPVRRKHLTRIGTLDDIRQAQGQAQKQTQPHLRSDDTRLRSVSSAQTTPTPLQNIGQQIGGMGAAVGKRGWDMFKQWSSSTGPAHARKMNEIPRRTSIVVPSNESTRRWLAVLNGPENAPAARATLSNDGKGIFGRPLRESVLLTRLGPSTSSSSPSSARQSTLITNLDFGTEFKIDLPNIDAASAESNCHHTMFPGAADRQVARLKYLPAIVVRCIEAIEVWGLEEEGIYRLSGRASHTTKLRQVFHSSSLRNPGNTSVPTLGFDLRLVDIGPAELDLNSVCSVLKAYLRELPEPLIPEPHASIMNAQLQSACGVHAVGYSQKLGLDAMPNDNRIMEHATAVKASSGAQSDKEQNSQISERVARAVADCIKLLPAVNWYLLRELAMHLNDLTQAQVVAKTRMTLSNLCLILAPTLSLSVPMMRALVEQKDLMFGHGPPSADPELDQLDVHPLPEVPSSADFVPLIDVPRMKKRSLLPPIRDEHEKRTSMATVTDKRQSVSSISTVQPPSSVNATGPDSHPSHQHRLYSTLVLDHDDRQMQDSPIAAKYIRQRTESITNALDLPNAHSDVTSIARDPTLPPKEAERSKSAFGERDSNNGSSGPPSNDGFSSAASSMAPSLNEGLSTSTSGSTQQDGLQSSSLTSIATHGALDRPRPRTGNSARFFASGKNDRVQKLNTGRTSRGGSDATTMSLKSSNSDLSASLVATFANNTTHRDSGGVVQSGENKDSLSSSHGERLVDEAPVDMKAIRQFWSGKI